MITEYFINGGWADASNTSLQHGQDIRERAEVSDEWVYKNYIDPNYVPEVTPSLVEVVITKVTGAVKHNTDFTWVTVPLGEDVLVEFDLAIGEEKVFNFFLSGLYGTPPDSFFAKVDKSGKGRVTLNFNAAGKYRYSDIEANMGVTPQKYSTKDILIEVGKATGDFLTDPGA